MDEINWLLDAILSAAYRCGYYQASLDHRVGYENDKEYYQGMLNQNGMQQQELREELIAWLKQRK